MGQNYIRLGVDEGLSQSTVVDIFQDSKGRLWISTADGLNWFDGRSFHVFHNSEKVNGALPSNYFSGSLYEDINGRIWSGSRSGLCYLNPDSGVFHSVFFPPEINNGKEIECRMIGTDQKGYVFFHTSGNRVVRYDPEKGETIVLATFPADNIMVRGSFISGNEIAFLFSDGLRIAGMDGKVIRTLHFPSKNIELTNEPLIYGNTLYLSGKSGCWRWDKGSDLIVAVFSQMAADAIAIHGEHLFIGNTEKGVICIDMHTGVPDLPKQQILFSGPSPGMFKDMISDRMGNLCCGIEGKGVCIYNLEKKSFRLYRKNILPGMAFSSDYIRTIYVAGDDRIWLGTYQGGLMIYDRKNDRTQIFTKENSAGKFPGNTIVSISADAKNRFWIVFPEGVFLTDEKISALKSIPFSYSGESPPICRQIVSLKNGTIVAPTEMGLFVLNEREKRFELISGQKPFRNLFEDSQGNCWLGGFYGYLFKGKITQDATGIQFSISDSLFERANIRDFAESPDRKKIYMASEKGIMIYDLLSGEQGVLNRENGLPNDFVYSLFFDERGALWATSDKGLIAMNLSSKIISAYGPDDGLQGMEFNTGALFIKNDGEVFIGGISGFNSFFPTAIMKSKLCPEVFLTELRVKDHIQPLNFLLGKKVVRLGYEMNGFTFSYSNSSLSKAQRSKTAYFLEGYDFVWTETDAQARLRIESLKPGEYKLKVKAMNADGVWGEERILAHFIIEPPYWLTWWFLSLSVVLLMTFSVIGVQYIVKKRFRKKLELLKQQNKIQNLRLQISRDIHDDIGSGLSRITLMGQLMQRNKDDNYLTKISDTAKEMTSQLSQIVWSLNPDNDDIENTILFLKDSIHRFYDSTGIDVHIEETGACTGIKLDHRQRVNVIRCVRESLNNTLKYAEAKKVSVLMECDGQSLLIRIADDGTGFQQGEIRGGGNGLKIMEKRMNEIGGTFTIKSNAGKGTTISLCFPITT
ncbi:MAG: hypothetical protein IT223_02190 [Crocinitomicaceae bacterium]|nr:hypothetical protein [Crocinitomicaceae bacterium]